ncbi:MAG: amino acid-binding protein [Thermoplasmata archaeon]|nr:MAG: amino acid-binding protein [Thermoplasmata archaeon]
MWKEIERYFSKYPAQRKVAIFLLKKGLRIKNTRVYCSNVEMSHSKLGKAIGVDRRVVDATVRRICKNESLKRIYENLEVIAFYRDIAPKLGLGVVIITPDDASRKGILSGAAKVITDNGLTIRQAIADDPFLVEDPKLTIVTNEKIPGKVVEELKKVSGVRGITIL